MRHLTLSVMLVLSLNALSAAAAADSVLNEAVKKGDLAQVAKMRNLNLEPQQH